MELVLVGERVHIDIGDAPLAILDSIGMNDCWRIVDDFSWRLDS